MGVPGPGPGVLELPPPQAISKIRPLAKSTTKRTESSLELPGRRAPEATPRTPIPRNEIVSHAAYTGCRLLWRAGISSDEVAAVVLTVSVEVVVLPARLTDDGLSEHVGARAGAGVTTQATAIELVKPSRALHVMVALADWPAVISLGLGPEAITLKSGFKPGCVTT